MQTLYLVEEMQASIILASFLTGGGVGSAASASKPVLGVTSPLGKLGLAGAGIAIGTTTNAIGSGMISGNTRDSSC